MMQLFFAKVYIYATRYALNPETTEPRGVRARCVPAYAPLLKAQQKYKISPHSSSCHNAVKH